MCEHRLGNGPGRDERTAALVADIPARRFGQPAEVTALAVLASDEATYMVGAELTIDDGLLAGSAANPGG